MRVPLTFRWYLEYREVLRCLRLSDLVLSDSMPQSSRICPRFVRWPSPCNGEWDSFGPVASGRISRDQGDGTVSGRLTAAAAAWGRCHLACHGLPGGRSDRVGWAHLARLPVGRCLGAARVCCRALIGAPRPVVRQGSRWAGPLPEHRLAAVCRKSRTRSVMSDSAEPCRGGWHLGCAPSPG